MANPMYRQIADALRAQIESGELPPGSQLPTELDLRNKHDASRNTVRDAIKWLTALGLVETKAGQGTFVVEALDPFVTTLTGTATGFGGGEMDLYSTEMTAENRKFSVSPVQVEIQAAPDDIAEQLRLRPDTEVISRHERRFIDGLPWSMQTSFYPAEFADRGAEKLRRAGNITEGTVTYLDRTLGLKQVGYRDLITCRSPNAIEADFFRIASDGRIPMYVVSRTAFDGNGQPMRLTITTYPSDRNQFIVIVGEVPDQKVQKGVGSEER
jgi:GntR family transcriptional regulator